LQYKIYFIRNFISISYIFTEECNVTETFRAKYKKKAGFATFICKFLILFTYWMFKKLQMEQMLTA